MRKNKKKEIRNITVYVVLRFLVILTAIFQFLQGNWDNVFGCVLVLVLFTVPTFIEKKLKIDLPNTLEAVIYMFIFSAQILGEMQNFYGLIPFWDTLLHTLNGFIFAGVGFSLVDILNRSDKTKMFLSPMYVVVVAVSFSITIGTVWEFFEYGMDQTQMLDMQKDDLLPEIKSVYLNKDGENIAVHIDDIESTTIKYGDGSEEVIIGGYLDVGLKDTMKDMIVNAIGALVFAFFGFFYIKDNEKYEFTKHFIPKKM